MKKHIDINCDLGEGIGNEALLMPYISSCNIACGGHAGDEETMALVVDLAHKFNVKIGAHPSFPDRVNFGRQKLMLSSEELYQTVFGQIAALKTIVETKGCVLHHVKPHGALYNLAAVDVGTALVIVEVVKSFGKDVALYVPFRSVIAKVATENKVPIIYEAFADRNYNDDLTLVPRHHNNALIHNPDDMFKHVYGMLVRGKVTTLNGVGKTIKADTFCLHSDGENIVHNVQILVQKLGQHNVAIL